MTTHSTPSTVIAAHTALPSSGRHRTSMNPSARVKSEKPAVGWWRADSAARSSARQDSSKKWVTTRVSPEADPRDGARARSSRYGTVRDYAEGRAVAHSELMARTPARARTTADPRDR